MCSPECLPQQKCVGFFAWHGAAEGEGEPLNGEKITTKSCSTPISMKMQKTENSVHMRAPSILGNLFSTSAAWMRWRMWKWANREQRPFLRRCDIVNFIVYRFSHFVKEKKTTTSVIPIHSHEPLRKWRENVYAITCAIKQTRWIQGTHTLTQEQQQCVGTTTESEWDDGLRY